MNVKNLAAFLSAIGILCLAIGCATGPEAVIAPAIAGLTARQVINDVDSRAQSLLNQANREANAVEGKAATDVQMVTQNALLQLSSDLDEKIDRLSSEERNIIQAVYAAGGKLDNFGSTLVDLRSDVSIDLMNTVNQIPFTQKVDFLIDRIEGTKFDAGDLAVKLRIKGIGIADQSNLRQARITRVTLNGHDVDSFEYHEIDDRTAEVQVPAKYIEATNPPTNQISFIELRFFSDVVSKRSWGRQVAQTYSFKTTIIAVPHQVGVAQLTYEEPINDWVTVTEGAKSSPFSTPAYRYPKSTPSHQHTLCVDAGKRLRPGSVRWDLTGPIGWSSFDPNYHPVDGRPKITTYNNDQCATVTFLTWGPSFTVVLVGDIQEMRQTGTARNTIPVPILANEPVRVSIPATATAWQLDGKTIQGKKLTIAKGEVVNGITVHEQPDGNVVKLSFAFSSVP